MAFKLHSYQAKAAEFAINNYIVKNNPGVALIKDPGLGKTLTSLYIINMLRDLGEVSKVLLVAPLRVCKLVWPLEVSKWGFDFTVASLHGKKLLPKEVADIELINFESLSKLEPYAGRWDFLLVDEVSKLKSWTSVRTKSMRKMLPSFRRRLVLTGTPVSEGCQDVFVPIYICDNGERLGKNVTVFRSRFLRQEVPARGMAHWGKWVAKEGSRDEIISRISDIAYRVGEEELAGMPELVVNDILCELPAKAKNGYNKLKRDLLLQLESGDVFAANAASAYAKCKQYAGGAVYDEAKEAHEVHDAKLEAMLELHEEIGSRQLLIFYNYKHERDRLRKLMPGCKVIDGESPKKELVSVVEAWVAGKIERLVCQVQSTSHGLNLQGHCNNVAYFSMPDSLDNYEQSYRRVHRQGAKNTHTKVFRLITRGTVDEVVRDRVDGKHKSQQEFLQCLRNHARQTA